MLATRFAWASWRSLVAAVLVLGVVWALAACGGGDGSSQAKGGASSGSTAGPTATPTPRPSIVDVGDNIFSPLNLSVKVGVPVTWKWSGSNQHSVVGKFDGAEVKSERQTAGAKFEFTFTKAGTFEYQCGVHGASMSAKVIVQ
jgi:plastocyanin